MKSVIGRIHQPYRRWWRVGMVLGGLAGAAAWLPAPADAQAGAAAQAVETAQPDARRDRHDLFRFGGSGTIAPGDRVRGDAVVVLGSLVVEGEVTGDVVVVGGEVEFGPAAQVGGDVVIVGGPMRRAPSAALPGAMTHIELGRLNPVGPDGWMSRRWPFGGGWRVGGRDLAGTVVRILFLALLASGVLWVLRAGFVDQVAARARAEPIKAGLVGFLAQMLALPTLVFGVAILVVSLIGIPLLLLLPFVMLAAAVVLICGFSVVAMVVGDLARARFGALRALRVGGSSRYVDVWAGVALILAPTLAGGLLGVAGGLLTGLAILLVAAGACIEYAAWTTGLGAILLNRFGPLLRSPAPDGSPGGSSGGGRPAPGASEGPPASGSPAPGSSEGPSASGRPAPGASEGSPASGAPPVRRTAGGPGTD